MNHKKLAKMLNVSPSTVSKALSGSTEISRETAERIQQLAIDVGYFKEKNKRKRDYTNNDSLFIALIVPEIMGYHYASIVTFFKNEIEARGGQVSIYISDFLNDKANQILKSIILHGAVDGVIMFGVPNLAVKPNIPIVTVNGFFTEDYDGVAYDFFEIMKDAVLHLSELGHKKIGFVGEPHTHKQLEYFKEIIKRENLCENDDFIYTIDSRFEEIGAQAAERIALQKDRPTALIAAYDEVAISLTGSLERKGIRVPDDISVMGINNISSTEYAQIPLTTIDTFSSEQYGNAVNLLFDKILNETESIRHITIQHKLIKRQTTKTLDNEENKNEQ